MSITKLSNLSDDFYDKIKLRLYKRIGQELCLAYRVLDLGCGSCELARYLAEVYEQQVTGIDILGESFPSYQDLGKAYPNINCIRHDGEDLGFLNHTADAAIMLWSLHEMRHPQKVLQEAKQAIRAGGKMLIVDFPSGSLASKLWNENYYTAEEVERLLLEAGFEDVDVTLSEQKQVIWATAHRKVNPYPKN